MASFGLKLKFLWEEFTTLDMALCLEISTSSLIIIPNPDNSSTKYFNLFLMYDS